jgi:glucose/arabinose dehydrogenase
MKAAIVITAGACLLFAHGVARAVDDLIVPDGFQVQVFHPGVGTGARHLVVRDNGDVLIARIDGRVIGLRDGDGDGRADLEVERALPVTTSLVIHDGYLYFSDDVSVSRLLLGDTLMPEGAPETVVEGFPEQRAHASKTLAFDPAGNLYVNVGVPSNACMREIRTRESPGQDPCPELELQGAIWRYPAGQIGLTQTDGERWVTGIRNVLAMDWHWASNALYFVNHGRDQLDTLWPDRFTAEQNAELPAEEFHRAVASAHYGWPYTFVDPATGKRLVAPEYGGDGIREAEPGRYQPPLHNFPAHWAPNGMVFYRGDAFPPPWDNGVYITWHGSWNRAPLPQRGYQVSFVPFDRDGMRGMPLDFITGFMGAQSISRPSDAAFRPMGIGVGPDGALYVSDTRQGRIWRVTRTPAAIGSVGQAITPNN